MRTIDEMVAQEVIYPVSQLVHEITSKDDYDEETRSHMWSGPIDLDAVAQALLDEWTREELIEYIDDCEMDAGTWTTPELRTKALEMLADEDEDFYLDWSNHLDIEDYRCEVFEHWIVSDYFARKLRDRGETVTFDFHGLTVWSRCTTGQAIEMDGVIKHIYEEISTT